MKLQSESSDDDEESEDSSEEPSHDTGNFFQAGPYDSLQGLIAI